ncbi:cellulose binding domain-containing protein [Saccharothrix saharensis]|uniref:Cellulose binding domain-containing protein n=1 Tax=Saccharothrix saharensis TaxID=571190 RepID=A0A543JRF3_9PSEU|nr:cellulose binding domain-containing protein [Saccharothrix saharensis]TQM85377.1 cellulose binding domain-containing protein [Saccharothrix saharensis]
MQLRRALPVVLASLSGVIAPTTAAASAAEVGSTPALAAVGCQFQHTGTDFGFGFTAVLKVTNTGSDPATDWWVEFDLPAGVVIETTHSARFSPARSGHIQANAPAWLPTLAPGASANVGFNGSKPVGTALVASNVTLNDVPCTG